MNVNAMSRSGPSRFWEKRWFLAATTVGLALILAAAAAYLAFGNKLVDFYVYYIAAAGFRRGIDVYTLSNPDWNALASSLSVPPYAFPYRYPPLTAIMAMPLLALPPRWAGFAWSLGSSAAALAGMALLASALTTQKARLPLAWALLALFTPLMTTLYAGQVNTWMLFAVALALWAFKRERPLEAGLALSLGTMIKVMPAALIVYFAWRRQWRVVIGAAIGLAALGLLSMAVVGPGEVFSYVRQAALVGDPRIPTPYPANQSLNGFFSRLLTANEWGGSLADDPALAMNLARGLGLIVLAATFGLCRPGRPIRGRVEIEVGMVIIAMELLAALAFYHLLTLMLIPTWALLQRGLDGGGWRDPRVWWVALSLVLIDVQGLLWHRLVGWTWLLSLGTYAMVLLWGVSAWEQEIAA